MTAASTPTPPRIRVSIGITGHRADHAGIANNSEQIAATLAEIFAHIDKTIAAAPNAPANANSERSTISSSSAAARESTS